jgi:hypothetical protein
MSLQYVYEQHEDVARFVAELVGSRRGFGKCKAIGVLDAAGRPIAGIVYHNYQPEFGTIELTGAALPKSNWLTRETLWRMYEYPFQQLNVQMVTQLTPAENEVLLDQLARGGYMFTLYPRAFGRGRDGVICSFTREAWEQCKFMRWKQRQPAKEAA